MSLEAIFDALLATAIPLVAWRILAVRGLIQAIILFVAFGLLLALTWVRLGAPDIALAEAAVGAGITGALFLNTLGALRHSDQTTEAERRPAKVSLRLVAALPVLVLALMLVRAARSFGERIVDVPARIEENLPASGASNPVTAVLLNFRSYDTLLEVVVLMLAAVAVWSLGLGSGARQARASAVLRALVRLLTPLMVLVGGYLLWVGTSAPGGAFQAGAVLAALGLFLLLASLVGSPLRYGRLVRAGLVVGIGTFTALGAGTLLATGRMLGYPEGWEHTLILLVETGLAASIAVALLALFVVRPPEGER